MCTSSLPGSATIRTVATPAQATRTAATPRAFARTRSVRATVPQRRRSTMRSRAPRAGRTITTRGRDEPTRAVDGAYRGGARSERPLRVLPVRRAGRAAGRRTAARGSAAAGRARAGGDADIPGEPRRVAGAIGRLRRRGGGRPAARRRAGDAVHDAVRNARRARAAAPSSVRATDAGSTPEPSSCTGDRDAQHARRAPSDCAVRRLWRAERRRRRCRAPRSARCRPCGCPRRRRSTTRACARHTSADEAGRPLARAAARSSGTVTPSICGEHRGDRRWWRRPARARRPGRASDATGRGREQAPCGRRRVDAYRERQSARPARRSRRALRRRPRGYRRRAPPPPGRAWAGAYAAAGWYCEPDGAAFQTDGRPATREPDGAGARLAVAESEGRADVAAMPRPVEQAAAVDPDERRRRRVVRPSRRAARA